MAEPKTKKTTASVPAFLNAIEDETRRADAKAIARLMQDASGEKPALWGTAIVGFGTYKTASGDWPLVAFASRKTSLVLYISSAGAKNEALLKKLGKHKLSGGCLHIKKLSDVDAKVLYAIVERTFVYMRDKYA